MSSLIFKKIETSEWYELDLDELCSTGSRKARLFFSEDIDGEGFFYQDSDGNIFPLASGGSVGGNTILNGSGEPASSLGSDGDFYIDTDVYEIYGPKTGGNWGSGVPLIVEPTYQNSDPTTITVGGYDEGTTFPAPITFSNFVQGLLYPELFGALTAPSHTFTSTTTGLQVIGAEISFELSSTFNRGSIDPQYESAEPFRSGAANEFEFEESPAGTGFTPITKTALDTTFNVVDHEVIEGAQSWRGRVSYDAGVQPQGSNETPFDSPLPAGSTSFITRTITGVYPTFATSINIVTLTQQSLVLMNSPFVTFNMVAESGSDKQKAEIPDVWSAIVGIAFFNTVSNAWEWVNGSPANSLLTFTTSPVTNTIEGNSVNYTRYTHNGSLTGARQLRWYTTTTL